MFLLPLNSLVSQFRSGNCLLQIAIDCIAQLSTFMASVHPFHGLFQADSDEKTEADCRHMDEEFAPTVETMLRWVNFQQRSS